MEPAPIKPTKIPKVSFVFVNRFGYRNDSTQHGLHDTIFGGFCSEVYYYKKNVDSSFISEYCFSKYDYQSDFNRLRNSITLKVHDAYPGCRYALRFYLNWVSDQIPRLTKKLTYSLKCDPSGLPLNVLNDTIIKFIWPLDSNSGRFVLTKKYPP